jgi:mycothiol synthase
MDELTIEVHQNLDDQLSLNIQDLLAACADIDGLNPFSEHTILHMQYGNESHVQHFSCSAGDQLVGYAHVDFGDVVFGDVVFGDMGFVINIEVAVLPDYRRHGVGKKLIEKILQTHSTRPIRLWAHGLNTGAASLAVSCGFKQVRTLWQMRRSLITQIPQARLPDGLNIRNFDAENDLDSLLACNQVAFANHPEQGQWTKSNLQQRMSESWFDPNGLKVATHNDEIVAYAWMKVDEANAGSKLGEIYVVGVNPAWQKHGLGRFLTLEGLRYLRSLNLNTALLYVDAENEKAISLYQSLGFSHWDTDTSFQLD